MNMRWYENMEWKFVQRKVLKCQYVSKKESKQNIISGAYPVSKIQAWKKVGSFGKGKAIDFCR